MNDEADVNTTASRHYRRRGSGNGRRWRDQNNQMGDNVQKGEQLDSKNTELGTSEGLDAEFFLIPENDTLPSLCETVHVANEEDVGNKFKNIEASEDIEVWESDKSINDIEISASSSDDDESTNTNSSSVGEDRFPSQPLVDVVKEAEHPDIEQKHGDEDISITISSLYETKLREDSNNIVVQRLLRGPRYFDPHEVNREGCSFCGEEDHQTAKCALKKRKKPCFICADPGHNGMRCKKGQECFTCKRLGHLAEQCPNKPEESYPTSNTCLICGGSGHDMWTCNIDYPHEDLKEIQCYICKDFGHLCCVDYLDIGSRELSCCNCGDSGHVGSECTKEVEITTLSTFSKPCKKCKRKAKKRAQRKAAKEGKDTLVSKVAHHDLNKAQKRIKYKERASLYARKPLIFREPGSNVWRAPSTVINNNENVSAAALFSSQNFPHPQNLTQITNHFNTPSGSEAKFPDTISLFAHGNFPNPQNSIEMSNHFNSPVTPYSNFPIPQNHYQTLNNPPVPGSQSYYPNPPGLRTRTQFPFPVPRNSIQMSSQHVFPPGTQAYRGRNYSVPQNHVQMYSHQVGPPGDRTTLYRPWSPWSSTFSLNQMRNKNDES